MFSLGFLRGLGRHVALQRRMLTIEDSTLRSDSFFFLEGYEHLPLNELKWMGNDHSRAFLHGNPHLEIDYYVEKDAEEGSRGMRGSVNFKAGVEGTPGHVHGGCMTAVMNEAMGTCCWLNGKKVAMTANKTYITLYNL